MIFETHAHYDDDAFDIDRDEILKELPSKGIEYVINICSTIESVDKTLELAEQYEYIYGAIGIHPDTTKDLNEENFLWLKEQAKHKKVVAIGEVGLDYYWDSTERSIQKEWFERQIELAKELELPLVIHSREAAKDTFDVMKATEADSVGGIIHCFGYSKEMASMYLNLGYSLGIGGVLTFKNGKKLKEVVEYAPLEQLVLETDAPYLAPVPFRGKRNNSTYLSYVAEEIARIKNIDYNTVIKVTNENAKRIFKNIK